MKLTVTFGTCGYMPDSNDTIDVGDNPRIATSLIFAECLDVAKHLVDCLYMTTCLSKKQIEDYEIRMNEILFAAHRYLLTLSYIPRDFGVNFPTEPYHKSSPDYYLEFSEANDES